MSDILKPLPPVSLDFLSNLSKSRAVMEAAEGKAQQLAQEKGTGMKNVPLAPRGATPAAKPRTKFDALPDQDIEYLTALPAGMNEQFTQSQPVRDVHAAPISTERIKGSEMPEAVKKAMMAFPIDTTPPLVEASLTNVRTDLMEFDKPVRKSPTQQVAAPAPQKQRIVEQAPAPRQQAQPVQNMDIEMIQQLVRDELTNQFIKTIREDAIKDTIRTLMKEGIIPKKK